MTKIIRASEIGAKLNSNVYTGGGTDDTQAIQNALDQAKNGGIHLIMDGAALVSGLKVYSNTTIECLNKDCGFFLADDANDAILKNGNQNMQQICDRNIRIIGGTYNGNCLKQAHHIDAPPDDAVFSNDAVLWPLTGLRFVCGFMFAGVEDFEIRGITMRDCRTFAITIGMFKHVTIENVWIDIPNHILEGNQDGIHFWGEGQFLTMRNIRGFSGDDFIALNTDEYDGVSSITDVLIDGVFIDGATRVIRLLSRGTGRLDRITIRNVTGTYKGYGFFIEPHFIDTLTGGNVGNITFENIDLRPFEPACDIHTPFLFNISINCEHLTFRNIYNHMPQCQRNIFQFCYDKTKVSKINQITIEGLYLYQENNLDDAPITVDVPIRRLSIRNVEIICAEGKNAPFISVGEEGHIGTLVINGFVAEGLTEIDNAPENTIDNKLIWNTSIQIKSNG